MPNDELPVENRFPNTNWNFLLEKISQQRCVLFLGPQALPASIRQVFDVEKMKDENLLKSIEQHFPGGISTVEQALHAKMLFHEPSRSYIRKYYPDLGFFLFQQEHLEAKFITEMRDFFRQTSFGTANQMLRKLAQVPFHLIVTLTPDHLLQQAFQEQGLDMKPHQYLKRQITQPIEPPVKERPVLYQLFGSIEEDESLLLTHNSLFDYFNAIFHEYQLPHNLIEKLKETQSFIFLGLPFEKWYMQLLLRLLSIHLPKFNHLAVKKFADAASRDLWKEQFHMELEETDTATAFVEELHRRCEARDMLRKPATAATRTDCRTEVSNVKTLVGEGQIIEAMEYLQTAVERLLPGNQGFLNDLALVKGKYKRLDREIILGIAGGEVRQQQQQSAQAILHLADELLTLAAA